jgi:hypothetical protein
MQSEVKLHAAAGNRTDFRTIAVCQSKQQNRTEQNTTEQNIQWAAEKKYTGDCRAARASADAVKQVGPLPQAESHTNVER